MTTNPSDIPSPHGEVSRRSVAPAPGSEQQTSTGLAPTTAGLLTYLLGWVTGLIFYLVEKEHGEVRFHAAQSILVSVTLIAAYIALSILAMVPVIGLLALAGYAVVGLGGLALWIYLLIQGYHLNHVRLPIIGGMAEQWAAR